MPCFKNHIMELLIKINLFHLNTVTRTPAIKEQQTCTQKHHLFIHYVMPFHILQRHSLFYLYLPLKLYIYFCFSSSSPQTTNQFVICY